MIQYNKKLLTTLEDRFDRLQAYLDRVFQFEEDEDLYSFVASIMYNKDVDECREVNPDGSPNPGGKDRRNRAKQFILPVIAECGSPFEESDEVASKYETLATNYRKCANSYMKCAEEFDRLAENMRKSNTQGQCYECPHKTDTCQEGLHCIRDAEDDTGDNK